MADLKNKFNLGGKCTNSLTFHRYGALHVETVGNIY